MDVPEGNQQIDWNQYLADNPDVAADPFYGTHPQNHYEDHGKYETWRKVPYVAAPPGTASNRDATFGSLLKPFSLADFDADPGRKLREDQGLELLNRQLGAKGLLNSGNRLLETVKFGQDLASQEYGNAYNRYRLNNADIYDRLSGVANTGQASANRMATAGSSYANNLSDLYTNNANNQAASQLTQGQLQGSMWSGIGDAVSRGLNNYRLSQTDQQAPAPVWNRDRPYTG